MADAESRGYVRVEQLTVADMDCFYASWRDGKRAGAKLERLKSFVRSCLKRERLSNNIAEDLQAPEGSSIPANERRSRMKRWHVSMSPADALGEATSPAPVIAIGAGSAYPYETQK